MSTFYIPKKIATSNRKFKLKKGSLLSRVSMLLLISLLTSGIASAQTVQIGSGTANSQGLPINSVYGYSYSQQIYLASELLAAGASGITNQITKIRFYPNNNLPLINSQDWVIYLGHTTQTQFTTTTNWIPTTAMTEVFNDTVGVGNGTGGWKEIILTTPFNWDGTSNIVVAIDENTPGSNNYSLTWAGFSAPNRGIINQSSVTNPNPLAPPTATLVTNRIAQIQFDGFMHAPCTGTPNAGIITGPDSVCADRPFVLEGTFTPPLGLLNYQWQESIANSGVWTNIVGATSYTHAMDNGISASTDFRLIVTCNNSNQTHNSNIFKVKTKATSNCPCVPLYISTTNQIACSQGDNIKDVILTGNLAPGINNLNTPCPFSGFTDYTNLTANVTAGNTYSGNVTTSSTIAQNVRIWIDYNRNGSFETNETIDTIKNLKNTSLGAFTFSIPASTYTGNYIMRVRLAPYVNVDSIDPCNFIHYGEAHDYSVYITGITGPLYYNLGTTATICAGQSLVLNAGNPGATYLWNDNSTNQTLTVNAAGTYFVTISSDSNSITDSIVVSMKPLPSAENIIATNSSGCTYTFNVLNAQDVSSYSWDFGDGSPRSTNATTDHSFAQSGQYEVVLTMENNCGISTKTSTVVCSTLGIRDLDLNKNALKLYPNPTSDKITIENSSNLKMEYITVFNILGQVVHQDTPQSATKHQMNVSKLSAGLYTVQIKTEQGVIMRKFEVLK